MRGVWYLLVLGGQGWVLARWGALFWFPLGLVRWGSRVVMTRKARAMRPGQRLAAALQSLGPGAIKFGQVLATRADLLGVEIARDLTALQDRLTPFAFAKAAKTIEVELGQPLEKIFTSIDRTPVAAASIAQVHKAITVEGETVAVKVVRPEVRRRFHRDLDMIAWAAGLAEGWSATARQLRLVDVARNIREMIVLELDLRLEAAAADELRQTLGADSPLYIPRIDWQRTSASVLTMEWLDGVRIDDRAAILAQGGDLNALLAAAAGSFFQQVYVHGFFHADLHPGNLFVLRDGRLAALDFGLMGRLDQGTRRTLAMMLHGFLTRNYLEVADAYFEAGYVPPHHSKALFAQACRSVGEPIVNKPLNEISLGTLLGQLFAIAERFEMHTQPQLLVLQRALIVTEGLGWSLNPGVNMWDLARPAIEQALRRERRPLTRLRQARQGAVQFLHRAERFLEAGERLVQQPPVSFVPASSRSGRWLLLGGVIGAALTSGVYHML